MAARLDLQFEKRTCVRWKGSPRFYHFRSNIVACIHHGTYKWEWNQIKLQIFCSRCIIYLVRDFRSCTRSSVRWNCFDHSLKIRDPVLVKQAELVHAFRSCTRSSVYWNCFDRSLKICGPVLVKQAEFIHNRNVPTTCTYFQHYKNFS